MTKLTRRQAATFDAMTDETIARAWLALDTDRVKTGPNKGQPTRHAMRYGDMIIAGAARRGLSLPCENETLADWADRMARRAANPEFYA